MLRRRIGHEPVPFRDAALPRLQVANGDRRANRRPIRARRRPAEGAAAGPEIGRQWWQTGGGRRKESTHLHAMRHIDPAVVHLDIEAVSLVAARRAVLQPCEIDVIVDRGCRLEARLRPIDLDVLALPVTGPVGRVEGMPGLRGRLHAAGIKNVVAHVEIHQCAAHGIDGPFPHASSVGRRTQEATRSVDMQIEDSDVRQARIPGNPVHAAVVGAEHADVAPAEQAVAVGRIDHDAIDRVGLGQARGHADPRAARRGAPVDVIVGELAAGFRPQYGRQGDPDVAGRVEGKIGDVHADRQSRAGDLGGRDVRDGPGRAGLLHLIDAAAGRADIDRVGIGGMDGDGCDVGGDGAGHRSPCVGIVSASPKLDRAEIAGTRVGRVECEGSIELAAPGDARPLVRPPGPGGAVSVGSVENAAHVLMIHPGRCGGIDRGKPPVTAVRELPDRAAGVSMRPVVLGTADHDRFPLGMLGDADVLEDLQVAVAMLDGRAGVRRHVNATVADRPDLIGVVRREGEGVIVGVQDGQRGPRPVAGRRLPQVDLAVIDRVGIVRVRRDVEVVPGLAAPPAIEGEPVGMPARRRRDDQHGSGAVSHSRQLDGAERDRVGMRGAGAGRAGRVDQRAPGHGGARKSDVVRMRRRTGGIARRGDVCPQRRRHEVPARAAVGCLHDALDAAAVGEGGVDMVGMIA